MRVSLIAALDENGGIGLRGALPWRLSEDLKRFKRITMGHNLIMGRKTFESIGRALHGRVSIVVTRKMDYRPDVAPEESHLIKVAHSIEEALELAQRSGEEEVFVIGGGEIFKSALPVSDYFYLTRVHTDGDADTFFPSFDPDVWKERHREFVPADERNDYPSTFKVLERRKG